jgi:hypothetical protein
MIQYELNGSQRIVASSGEGMNWHVRQTNFETIIVGLGRRLPMVPSLMNIAILVVDTRMERSVQRYY